MGSVSIWHWLIILLPVVVGAFVLIKVFGKPRR
jgi:hypothetical protein